MIQKLWDLLHVDWNIPATWIASARAMELPPHPPVADTGVTWKALFDWAAYLVAVLAGLLWAQVKLSAKRDRKQYEKEIDDIHSVLKKCIDRNDFDAHEEREHKDQEQNVADHLRIEQRVASVDGKVDEIQRFLRDHWAATNSGK